MLALRRISLRLAGVVYDGRVPRSATVVQHGFYATPRLSPWSIAWFADSFAPLSRSGLPRRGHRLFGNVISFGKLLAVAVTFGFVEKRCRKNLPLSDPAFH